MAVTPWAQDFPAGAASWQESRNSGVSYNPAPAPTSTTQVGGATGAQRYRTQFTIPGGYSGTWTVTVSGDIYSNPPNVPAQLRYDGVNQGNVIGPGGSLAGPATFTLPVTPGAHTVELWIGQAPTTGAGLTVPNVTFDLGNVVGPEVPCDCCPIAAPARCAIVEVPFSSTLVSANPAGLTIVNLASTIDGTVGTDLSGFSPPVTEAVLVANPTTAFDYLFGSPVDRLVRLRWYNGGGGVLTDQDGFGLITVTFLDAALATIATMPWNLAPPLGNNSPPRQLDFAALNNVSRIRFSGFHKQNTAVMGTGSPLLRQVEAFATGPVFPCRRRSGALEWYDLAGNQVAATDIIPCP